LDSNLPTPRDDQDLKNWFFDGAQAAVTVYTVPAGKAFYLTQAIVTGATANVVCTILIDTTEILRLRAVDDTTSSTNFSVPILVSAGEALKITQGGNASTSLVGWVESA